MARGLLKTILALYPRSVRLKAARRRRARPVRPSHKVELWYRFELRRIVDLCRRAGDDVAGGMRGHWPAVADSVAPGLDTLLAHAASRFGNIGAVSDRLAKLAAQKALGQVDERLAKSIKAAVGVDISSYLEPTSEIGAAMRAAAVANVELIKSIPTQYLEKVGAAVEASYSAGQRWEDLAKEVKRLGDVTDARARLIARDQVSKLNASFNEIRQTSLGIARYTWSTSHDERVRRTHAGLDGTTQEWKSPPVVDGEAVNPGEAVNCRCVALPLLDIVDEQPAGGTALQEAA